MAIAESLLLAAGICFLFHATSAKPTESFSLCNQRTYGSPSVFPLSLGTTYIQDSNTHTYDLTIPYVCTGAITGVTLIVCDNNEEPDLRIVSNHQAYMTRNDGLYFPASVTGIVYCSDLNVLGSGGDAQKVSIKAVPSSRQGIPRIQHASIQDSMRSSDMLKQTWDQAQNQGLWTRHPTHAAQVSNSRQTADLAREALEADLLQSSLEKAFHKSIGQSSDASRIHLHFQPNQRLRRASQISENEKTIESTRDAKADKAQQGTGDQVKTQEVRQGADQATEALIKIPLTANSQRSRRGLHTENAHQSGGSSDAHQYEKLMASTMHQDDLNEAQLQAIVAGNHAYQMSQNLNGPQTTATIQQVTAANRAHNAALNHAQKQAALNEHHIQAWNARQISDAAREVGTSNKWKSIGNQAVNKAQMNEKMSNGNIRNNRLRRQLRTYDDRQGVEIAQSAKLSQANQNESNNPYSSEKSHNTKLANDARQADLKEAQQQAIQQSSRAFLANQGSNELQNTKISQITRQIAGDVRQTDLDQSRKHAIQQISHTIQNAQANNAEHQKQPYQTLSTNHERQTGVDQVQQHAIQEISRAIQNAQATNAEIQKQSYQTLSANHGRQIGLNQAQQQAIQEINHSIQNAQAAIAKIQKQSYQTLSANHGRQAGSDQAQQQAIHEISRAIQNAQATNAEIQKQSHQTLSAIYARQTGLDQAHQQAIQDSLRAVQSSNAYQSAGNGHRAIGAHDAHTIGLSHAEQKAILDASRMIYGAQNSDALNTADIVREGNEHAYQVRQPGFDNNMDMQLTAYRRILRASQSSEAEKTADAIRESTEGKTRQVAVDKMDEKISQEMHADQADAQAKNLRQTVQKRSRRNIYSSENKQADYTRHLHSSNTEYALDSQREADAIFEAVAGMRELPYAIQRANQARPQGTHGWHRTDTTGAINTSQNLVREALTSNALQAAMNQAANLGYAQYQPNNIRY